MPPDPIYLSVDQVLELHTLALTIGTVGLDGVRSHQQLAAAVMQPQQSAFGEDAYPSIAEKAAAYGFSIAEGQPFIDGNKRTALLTMVTFLDLNGYQLVEDDEEAAEMLESLGNKTIDQSEFFGWVCNHARPKSDKLTVVKVRESY